ncbi:MAG: ATP-dependent helicase, partial [Bdellovibrionales bacterium]
MDTPISPAYLENLNAPQREAVETLDGALLVLAGAGTGKTRVLTTRLAHIINRNHVFPSQILAVTFTNKAAQEMRERVAQTLGQPVEGWWLGTFHALAARMLRQHCQLVGLESNYTILDPDDQIRLVKQIMEIENIDTKKWAPKTLIATINRWKDRALTPDKVSLDEVGDIANGKLLHIYRIYQERLKTLNACDFGDLMLHMITIFKDTDNQVLADYHRRFRYIMVDEYQDTNTAQYLWLRLLAQGTGNICCVGDDDQSIYGWRGAEVGNILKFEQDFPGAKVVRLEQNYRSTGHILNAANGVISYNQGRLGKTLRSVQEDGEKVRLRGVWDGQAEARWITEEIEQLHRKQHTLSEIAILVRASFQMREFEEQFIQHAIPYRVVGGARFYERLEVRDALAYLRVVAQPSDDLALERIINKPKRGLGDATIQKLQAHARAHNMSLYVAIQDMAQRGELRAKVNTTLMALIDSFERWRSLINEIHHAELAWKI